MTGDRDTSKPAPRARRRLRGVVGWLRWQRQRLPERLIALGLPPAAVGWRMIRHIDPARHGADTGRPEDMKILLPEKTFTAALPANIPDRAALDPDPGWWGYSMRDVPARTSAATSLVTLSDVRVLAFLDGAKGQFTPAILDARDRAIALPQVRFRPGHAAMLRAGAPVIEMDEAVWFLERVYDNHSHWLTAHLPKLLLLRERGLLGRTIMPSRRTAAMDASLEMLGIDASTMPQYTAGTILKVARLTVPLADRFDPRHLRRVRSAFGGDETGPAAARVFISRARAHGRKLLNEDKLWPMLRARGFERIFMEELDFPAQVRLMQRTAVIVAPHGAGLTNMIFCPEGADIVEIADPGYPNPNFYALSAAMGHRYWLLAAEATGEGHALHKDLTVDIPALMDILARISAERGET